MLPPSIGRPDTPLHGRPSAAAALAALAISALAGCATTAAPAPKPWVPLAPSYTRGTSGISGISDSIALDAQWWQGFGDPTLDSLVDEALAANQDIAIAEQRLQQARAGAVALSSRLSPTLGVQASASRTQSGLPAPVKSGLPDTHALRGGLDLAWEIDLAGALRAARDAGQADAAAAAAGVVGARLLVASETGRQYFLLRGVQEQLRIVQSLAEAQRQTAAQVRSRWREGLASTFDLDRAEAEAEALAARLPGLRMGVGTAESRLAVLLGRQPSFPFSPETAPYAWPARRALATGQPSDLLRRRPDLVAAEARVAAEALRTAEARAQWWPKLFLGALVGRQDLTLNALNLAPVSFSNVALALSAPVFNAGRIEAGIESQSARAQEALLGWQKAVLVALQEVEDSLLVRTEQAAQASALEATLSHRRRSLQRAQSLQREGQIDLLALLDVQRSVLAGELALSESRLQQALAEVQLYKALGGGWSPAHAAAAPAAPSATSLATSPAGAPVRSSATQPAAGTHLAARSTL